jgi:hypothetical protein
VPQRRRERACELFNRGVGAGPRDDAPLLRRAVSEAEGPLKAARTHAWEVALQPEELHGLKVRQQRLLQASPINPCSALTCRRKYQRAQPGHERANAACAQRSACALPWNHTVDVHDFVVAQEVRLQRHVAALSAQRQHVCAEANVLAAHAPDALEQAVRHGQQVHVPPAAAHEHGAEAQERAGQRLGPVDALRAAERQPEVLRIDKQLQLQFGGRASSGHAHDDVTRPSEPESASTPPTPPTAGRADAPRHVGAADNRLAAVQQQVQRVTLQQHVAVEKEKPLIAPFARHLADCVALVADGNQSGLRRGRSQTSPHPEACLAVDGSDEIGCVMGVDDVQPPQTGRREPPHPLPRDTRFGPDSAHVR